MASPDVDKGVKLAKIALGTAAATGVLHYIYPYWANDIRKIALTRRMAKVLAEDMKRKLLVIDQFLEQARIHKYKTCIIYNNTVYTFGDMDHLSNKFANFVKRQGLLCGDTVAIMMYNEPAFLWMYLGFAKLGIACAFVNYNLRRKSITHCIRVCGAKLLVVGPEDELLNAVQGVSDELADINVNVWSCHGNRHGFFRDIQDELAQSSAEPISRDVRKNIAPTDVSVYIFTSGTTGIPKAAKVSHLRHKWSCHAKTYLGLTENERVYNPLPLYHSFAFFMGFGGVLQNGLTMILPKKFSVHNFWDDCRRHNATVLLYIGELCRYLLAVPETQEDKNHSIRLAVGSGLRQDIWDKFRSRFAIPKIVEIYASTEGGFSATNDDNTPGVVGKYSPYLKRAMGFHLVRYDVETAQPLKDNDGRCIPVAKGEVGLLIAPIIGHYDGYSDERQTERRLIRNAFKDGDVYCNMGDLLLLDKNYNMYFVDRIGDTFRWKGQNVATTEVAEVISVHPAVEEVNVYGVQIPGHDGRAGMAAVVLKHGELFDVREFYDHVTASLPMYACPLFLRMMKTLETTGTFKYKKVDLAKQGFNPTEVPERMYYMDTADCTYKPLDGPAYLHIVAGKAKL